MVETNESMKRELTEWNLSESEFEQLKKVER